jgi:hypothetical protein
MEYELWEVAYSHSDSTSTLKKKRMSIETMDGKVRANTFGILKAVTWIGREGWATAKMGRL